MRQYSFTGKILGWIMLSVVSLMIYGCSDPDPTVSDQCVGRTGTVGGNGVQFASYMPDCSQDLCAYYSEFIYGVGSPATTPHRLTPAERANEKYVTRKESAEKVPYSTGALTGARFLTRPISTDGTTSNTPAIISSMVSNGRTLKFLEYGDKWGDYWYSSDANCSLKSHPSVWSFGRIFDDELRVSDTGYYTVERLAPNVSGPYVCYGLDNQTILTQIADVTLENGQTYTDAVIFYYIYNNFSNRTFVDLDMNGIDTDLGITLPISAQTKNLAVSGLDIYAQDLGWIAGGSFVVDNANVATGSLANFSQFTRMECL